MAKRIIAVIIVLGALAGGLAWLLQQEKGREGGREADNAALQVVTTTTMVTDLVRIVGGERISVQGLMGPKVDPHSYQVTFADTAALRGADLIFYSGLHLEGKIQELLEHRARKKGGVFAVTDGIDKADLLKPQEELQDYYDPHVWGNPMLWAQCLESVVEALCRADPAGAGAYRQRGEQYRVQLQALHAWVLGRVAEVPAARRVLVTSHDAFYYFGKTYGFEVRGLQGVSTNSESGLRDRANLVEFIRARGLRTIFPESSVNDKGIRAVADEAGVSVSEEELFSDAMGSPGDMVSLHGETYDKGSYIGMIKHNVNTVVDGLK